MKTLLLVRHAKSSWDDPSLSDFDRPLNDRGKRDAPVMIHRLLDNKVKIDAFFSSPAKRASRTARIFAKEYKRKRDEIIYKTELYGAGESEFFEVIGKIDDEFDNVALFSHNPGLTDFANLLTETKIDNIPTCGVFGIKLKATTWAEFKNAEKEFWFFDYPKAVLSKNE
jgi:phosphohistidine phosphatase